MRCGLGTSIRVVTIRTRLEVRGGVAYSEMALLPIVSLLREPLVEAVADRAVGLSGPALGYFSCPKD